MLLSPEEAAQAPMFNTSVYLVSGRVLRYALGGLGRGNAQQEEYLSDMVSILAQACGSGGSLFHVEALRIDDEAVMAFNNPAELLEIDARIQARRRGGGSPGCPGDPGSGPSPYGFRSFAACRELERVYGQEAALLHERVEAHVELLERAAASLGPEAEAYLLRSPGRVNMMGRHIDHQGGHCNLMTIKYETLMAVQPPEDDRIQLYNLDSERFLDREFGIGELLADLPWDDWLSLVNSERVAHRALSAGGDWSQYAKAAVLRLQKKFAAVKLRGFDMAVSGSIPIGAGLSSSCTLDDGGWAIRPAHLAACSWSP